MKTIKLHEAKAHLSALINAVTRDEEVIIFGKLRCDPFK